MVFRYALALGLLCGSIGPAAGQELVARGGPSILANPSSQRVEGGSVSPLVQVGGRTWFSELFQVQGLLGYDDRFTAEAALYVRPFTRAVRIEPYVFAGFGVQLGDDDRRGVVPVGLGVEYATAGNVGVFFEMSGRWLTRREPAREVGEQNFHVAPTVGVAYRLGGRPAFVARGDRDAWSPDGPAIASPEPVAAGRPEPGAGAASTAPVMPVAATGASPWRAGYEVEDAGEQVRVPDGTFIMGLTDEDPLLLQTAGLKRVTVSAFYVDKYEVSNARYRAFLAALAPSDRAAMTPDAPAWERAGSAASSASYFLSEAFADYPVVAVTWHQAQRYCREQGGRLPTEAEWEFAARSGQAGGIYPWTGFDVRGADGGYLANFSPGRGLYAADGFAFTAPVASFPPTAWGLHHVSGNAAEWVADAYAPSYGPLSNFNPRYEDEGERRRVVRGGSWASDDFYIGVGVRDAQLADEASIYTGFRCAYDLGAYEGRPAEEAPTTSATRPAGPPPGGAGSSEDAEKP